MGFNTVQAAELLNDQVPATTAVRRRLLWRLRIGSSNPGSGTGARGPGRRH